MSITAPQRLALHAAARALLGDAEGDTLMGALPPSDTDIATRQDVEHHAALMRSDSARMEASLRGEIARVEGRLQPLEDRVGARITTACDALRDELTRRIHRRPSARLTRERQDSEVASDAPTPAPSAAAHSAHGTASPASAPTCPSASHRPTAAT